MELDTDISTADALSLGGVVLVLVGAFLPWVTRSVDAGVVEVSSTTAGIETLGVLTLVLGIVAGVVVLVDGIDVQESVAVGLLGLSTFLIAGWKIVEVPDPANPGVGLYLTVLGGLMAIGGGVLTHQAEEPTQAGRLGAT